ncbi:uncharacterized protein tnfrsf13b [Symphorus nematophorus]
MQACLTLIFKPRILPPCCLHLSPVSTNCKAQLGHYYDRLLKRCVRCADVCGRHPAECSQHCQTLPPPVITPVTTPVTTLTPPVTTKKLLVCVTPRVQNSRVPSALDDSTILLYPLLALCMVLLFFSLSLALVVFLRGARAKTPKPRPKDANHNQECAVQPGQEVGLPGCQPGQSFKDFIPNSSHPTDREPSEDSSPTETCVCVHCFPDLKALGQGNERPPSSIYPQTVLHIAQIENGGPLWTEGNLYTSGPEVHEDAVVGYDSLAISRDNWNGQM